MKNKKLLLLPLMMMLTLSACGPNVSSQESENSSTTSEQISGNDSQDSLPSSQGQHGITWSGIESTVVQLGDEFDLLEGVKAYDGIDGELEVVIEEDDFFTPNYVSGYTITYSATNSVNTKSIQYRSINVVKGVNVQNGSFEFQKAYWTFDQPGGTGTFTVSNEEAHISVTRAGTEAWALQLYQTGIQFEANTTYELSFKAKSNYGRSISAGFENVSNNYSMMVPGYQAVELTSEYTKYSVYATTTAAVGFVKAVIYIGQNLPIDATASNTNPIDLTLDDIRVRQVEVAPTEKRATFTNVADVSISSKDQFDLLAPASVVDYQGNDITDRVEIWGAVPISVNANTRMMISYRVVDDEGNFSFHNRSIHYSIAKAHPYNLINSDFTNGFQGWVADVNQTNGTAKADFEAVEGQMDVKISNGSNDNWHIQLYQQGISINSGKIYRTTIVAKASVARRMTIEISNPAQSFAKVASDLLELTTEFQTFVLEFKASVSTNAKFSLLLGGQGANTVSIDRFENEEITAGEATTIDFRTYQDYQVVNGDFNYGFYAWSKEATYGADIVFTEDRANNSVILDVINGSTADWHAQISQDGRKFASGKTYTITVEIEATLPTTLALEAVNVMTGPDSINQTLVKTSIAVTSTKSSFTTSFSPTVAYNTGKISLLIGLSDISTITVHSLLVTVA